MSSPALQPRSLLILGIVLPLAALIGYQLATPDAMTSRALIGLVIAVLSIPIFLKWHHPLLIMTWNGAMNAFFLPGRPGVWMVVGGISFGITVLSCVLNKEQRFHHVPSVTWSLIFLVTVVVVTAKLSGGIGLRALGGSQYGGKGYVFILGAVVGYFALSSLRILPERAQLFALLFFLSSLTYLVSNLAYALGPAFWFLFYAFPVDMAISQAVADFNPMMSPFTRLAGLGFASIAVCNVLILRYGIRGLLDARSLWRTLLFVAAAGASFLGGFRSTLVVIALVFAIQFCLEGLHRTRLLLVVLIAAAVGSALLVPLAPKLPLSMQRALSIVPFIEVDAIARADAQSSLDWRLQMWQILLPEVERYFLVGKGYRINPTDLYLAEESARRGVAKPFEGVLVSGDYHSGPLSLLIPFGIFGFIAFLCVLGTGGRVLYLNWKFGDASLKNINTFLFTYFLMKVIFYFFVFGAFYNDLAVFLGLIGFSLSMNHGVRRAPVLVEAPVARALAPVPA